LSRDEAAYVLGTIHWETNGTFEPVREAYWVKNAEAWRKKNLRYYPWYGRGFIQLTWDYNYKKAGEKIGVDLMKNPDLAMEPKNSAKIAVLGMKEGWFTGKDLDDYIDSIPESTKEDFLEFYNARRVVNGMDKANNIAVLAERYEAELVNYDKKTEPVKEAKALRTLLSIIIAILRKLFSK
jgi:putative chitinase